MWWMENQRVKLTWLWAVAAVLDLQDIDLAKEKGWKSNAKGGVGGLYLLITAFHDIYN